MKHHYIYKTTCLCGSLEGKYYIGKHSTQALPENCGYAGSGKIIKDYFKKYGKIKGETYSIEILEENQSKDENARREREIIGNLNVADPMCLNIAYGGGGGGAPGVPKSDETKRKISEKLKGHKSFMPAGWTHTPESRMKISDSNKGVSRCKGRPSPMKGRHHTDETKAKLSAVLTGKKHTPETIEKMRKTQSEQRFKKGSSPWNKGVECSAETRHKISEALKGRTIPRDIVERRAATQTGRKNTEEAIEKFREAKADKMKSVIAIEVDTGTNRMFSSISEAARKLLLNRSCIIGVLKGKDGRTQTGGYIFKYADQ